MREAALAFGWGLIVAGISSVLGWAMGMSWEHRVRPDAGIAIGMALYAIVRPRAKR